MARRTVEEAGRFEAYLKRLGETIGHADRHGPLRACITGLLLPGERKSVEPMAARLDPRHVRAQHQAMHRFVANAGWGEHELLRVARDYVLEPLERHAPVGAWVIDDTGMPKKGTHSVGVRYWCALQWAGCRDFRRLTQGGQEVWICDSRGCASGAQESGGGTLDVPLPNQALSLTHKSGCWTRAGDRSLAHAGRGLCRHVAWGGSRTVRRAAPGSGLAAPSGLMMGG